MKKRGEKLKIFLAVILFSAPCALCLAILRARLPDGIFLYSFSKLLWVVTPVSGICAAIALKGGATSDDEPLPEIEEDDGDASFGYTAPEAEEVYIEEYSELYRNIAAEDVPQRTVPDISAAISAQKADVENSDEADERERIWSEFLADGDGENSAAEGIYDYDSIPDTLPEGFSFDEEPEEETDDTDEYYEEERDGEAKRRNVFGAVRAAAAVICAASVLLGAALSGVYSAAAENGVYVGGLTGRRFYSWSDTERIEISPAMLGDGLRVRAYMKDGTAALLCSDSMLRGDAAADDTGDIELYAKICRLAEHGGADISVIDRKTIESTFSGSDEWDDVSRMLGDK